MGHGLPRHHRPGKVRSRFSEETFPGVLSRDGVAPIAGIRNITGLNGTFDRPDIQIQPSQQKTQWSDWSPMPV